MFSLSSHLGPFTREPCAGLWGGPQAFPAVLPPLLVLGQAEVLEGDPVDSTSPSVLVHLHQEKVEVGLCRLAAAGIPSLFLCENVCLLPTFRLLAEASVVPRPH